MEFVLAAVGTYKYLFLILAAVIEGPVISMIAGALLRTGDLLLVPTFIVLFTGDLIGDTIWYAIGYYDDDRFVRRFGIYINTTEEEVATMKRVFKKYHEGILLFSKTTTGFGFALATLIVAGMTRIPFPKYMALNALGQLFWTGMLLSIGYFLGDFYLTASSIISKMSAGATLTVLVFVFIGFRNYLRKYLTETT